VSHPAIFHGGDLLPEIRRGARHQDGLCRRRRRRSHRVPARQPQRRPTFGGTSFRTSSHSDVAWRRTMSGHGQFGTDAGTEAIRFVDHQRFSGCLARGASGSTGMSFLVVHDWGSALGFSWAERHRGRVPSDCLHGGDRAGRFRSWGPNGRTPPARFFQAQRSPAGEELILEKNLFIEYLLSAAEHRAGDVGSVPAPLQGSRPPRACRCSPGRGICRSPGEPADVVEIVEAYARWLSKSAVSENCSSMRDPCRVP